MVDLLDAVRRFLLLWVGTVVSPRTTFAVLPAESIRYGVAAVGSYGLLYVLAAWFLVRNRLRPVLPIPAERYYRWQLGFTHPVTLLGWAVLGTSAWALSTWAFGGDGTLSAHLLALAFAFYVPQAVVVWPPEMVAVALRPAWWGNLDAVGVPVLFESVGAVPVHIWIGLAWSVGLAVLAVRVVAGTAWPASSTTALVSVGATMLPYVLVIR